MNFYSFKEIEEKGSCVRYVRERLGQKVENDRCAATWRGGRGMNVALKDNEWYDHKAKSGGGLIKLCCLCECGGAEDEMSKQKAQDILGRWLGLTPVINGLARVAYDYRKSSTRYKELVAKGYSETRKYVYTDGRGVPAHFVVRMEHPTEEKQFIQCTPYQGSLHGVKTYLYNLPQILNSPWAIVVEGEKDADALIALGLPATTCNNGADHWNDDYTESLRGKDVIICRDNDDKGMDHAHLVMRSIADAAARIRVVCPSKQPKGDVSDWFANEGGTREKLYALMEKAPVISKEEAKWSDEALALYRAKKANERPFSNTVPDVKTVNGKEKVFDRPKPINDLIDEVYLRMIGFPKRLGDSLLFDFDRDANRIEFIKTKSAFIAWIGMKSKGCVQWRDVCGAVSKDELYSGLLRSAAKYDKVSPVPDWPKRADVYYTYRESLKPTPNHVAFETFMRFFHPYDDASRCLLRTLVAAPMYYKFGIQRPCWVIDSKSGQGSGKSTFCELLAFLYKCSAISTSKTELERHYQDLLKRIMSEGGRNSRILAVDNARGTFDNERFAELVTKFTITGRPPYGHGEETRPNDLTYIITINSGTADTDIASRSFFVYLSKPKDTNKWKQTVLAYIEKHRFEIFGDIIDILSSATCPDGVKARTRVPEFEKEVLFPMCGSVEAFNRTVDSILNARDEANVDEDKALRIVEIIKNEVQSVLKDNADRHVIFIQTALFEYWMVNVNDFNVRVQDVRNFVNTGRIDCIDPNVRRFPRGHGSNIRSGVLFYGDSAQLMGRSANVIILGMPRKGVASVVGYVLDEVSGAEVLRRRAEKAAREERERQPLFNQLAPAGDVVDAEIVDGDF